MLENGNWCLLCLLNRTTEKLLKHLITFKIILRAWNIFQRFKVHISANTQMYIHIYVRIYIYILILRSKMNGLFQTVETFLLKNFVFQNTHQILSVAVDCNCSWPAHNKGCYILPCLQIFWNLSHDFLSFKSPLSFLILSCPHISQKMKPSELAQTPKIFSSIC